jgi:hypothetical protein
MEYCNSNLQLFFRIGNIFGHCEKYSVLTMDGKAIVAEEYMDSPAGRGCKLVGILFDS